MKRVLQLLLLLLFIISVFALKCKNDSTDPDNNEGSSDKYKIVVNFEYGGDFSPKAYKNIYVIWIEDSASNFIQNIKVCKKLITGGVTGMALPYWKINKYPVSSTSEIDAVTSATKANTNFSISTILKDTTIRKFVLYFEIDRSYEPNDWFSDQPALLYSANIDLDKSASVYELIPIGWTPNKETQNVIPYTPMGQLQNEMRYITNHQDGSSFGAADTRSATKMVKKITAVVGNTDAK